MFKIYFLLLSNFVFISCEYDIGFEYLFKSNTEEVENVPLTFNASLPSWLKGTYIRNGLGRFEMGSRVINHAFDAFGKLSSWKFPGNGTCFFSTKFIVSDVYNKSLEINDIYPYQLLDGTTPPFTEEQKLESLENNIDNMNVNIYRYFNVETGKQEYVLLNDCWNLYLVDPVSLTSLQALNAEIPDHQFEYKTVLSSAHPLPEPETTNHIEYVTSLSMVPGIKHKVQVIRIKATNVREQITSFTVDRLSFMHSFSVTKIYAIFFLIPYTVDLMKMLITDSVYDSMAWSPTDPVDVVVVELKTGNVRRMTTENGFLMHHINAYETKDSKIMIDIPVYRNTDALQSKMLDVVLNPTKRNSYSTRAYLTRYIIDLKINTVSLKRYYTNTSLPTASRIDMPTINENYRFKEYCFAYGLAERIDDVNQGRLALAKKDLCGNTTDRVWYVENHYPSEAWFVPKPNGTSEDDGVLLSAVLDGVNKQSYIAVIDPRTMTTIAAANNTIRNPLSTHGRFFADVI